MRIRGTAALARLAILGLVLAVSSFAVDEDLFKCWDKYASINRRIPAGDWAGPLHPSGRFLLGQRLLDRQKAKLSPKEYDRFYEWYYDHFFSDRWATLQDNMNSPDNYLHRGDRYDREGQQPFTGYLSAHGVLDAKPLSKMDLKDLNEAHRVLLSWRTLPAAKGLLSWMFTNNSEMTPNEALGKVRTIQVGFSPGSTTTRDLEVLRRSTTGEPITESPSDIKAIHEVNPFLLYVTGNETRREFVYYLPLSRWRDHAQRLSPGLVAKLEAAEKESRALLPHDLEAEEAKLLATIRKEAQNEFLNNWDKILKRHERGWITDAKRDELIEAEGLALSKQADERFTSGKEALFSSTLMLDGETHAKLRNAFVEEVYASRWEEAKTSLKNAKSKNEAIDIVSDFYYDFVSIHPYRNGNGRMGRMLAEKLLGHYNLPPPLWTHLGEDVLLSRADFKKLFHDAVDVSREFHQDLDRLTSAGIPHTGVSVGFFAGQLDPKVADENRVDADEFLAWVAAGTREHKRVEDAILDFKKWRDSQTYERGNGRGNRLASALFAGSFGRLSDNQAAFNAKMERFYSPRGKVKRALEISEKLTDEDILEHFVEPQKVTLPHKPLPNTEAFANFNSVLVRAPKLVERWPNGWFGGSATAQIAGVVPTFFEGIPPVERTHGAKTMVEITARRREVATVDNGKTSETIKAANRSPEDRLVLHAGGIDPEAVLQVDAKDLGSFHRRVADRLAHNRVEIREYNGTHLLALSRYQRLKDGTWKKLSSLAP